MKYIIISPVKNEEQFIEFTLQSVISQTIIPIKWFIINDNSTDNTEEIVSRYSQKYDWINFITLTNFEPVQKSTGARSAALMNYARALINFDVEFIVKIDTDISFAEDFFEKIFNQMLSNLNLGLTSGHLIQDGILEKISDRRNIRGAVRVYKKECFDRIGKFYLFRGEDEIDTIAARYYGWETQTLDIFFHHKKQEGIRDHFLFNHYETGIYKGTIPYLFVYFFLTLFKHATSKPFLLGSLVQLYGYFQGRFFLKETDNPFPKEIRRFYRSEQMNKLKKIFARK